MKRLMELAGFLAAHGMWSFDEDGALTPFAGYEMADGARGLVRFLDATLEAGIENGRAYIEHNFQQATMAVMVSDGFYAAEGTQIRALIVEGRKYGDEPGSLAIAVPYRSPEGAAPLDILFPELLQFVWGGEGFDLLDAFFEGLESHGPAAEYWQEHARFERRKNAAKVP
jgi:hypothetical protein